MDSRRAGGGNRMMTSTTLQTNDIWSKTIGHDPHAGDAEAAEDAAARERQEERARGVMELARLDAIKQGGSNRGDNFAQSLFWGLKRKAPPRGRNQHLHLIRRHAGQRGNRNHEDVFVFERHVEAYTFHFELAADVDCSRIGRRYRRRHRCRRYG